jgi:hypothetical protein
MRAAFLAGPSRLRWRRFLHPSAAGGICGPPPCTLACHLARKPCARWGHGIDYAALREAKGLGGNGNDCDMACGWRYRFASQPQAFDVKGDRLSHLSLALS